MHPRAKPKFLLSLVYKVMVMDPHYPPLGLEVFGQESPISQPHKLQLYIVNIWISDGSGTYPKSDFWVPGIISQKCI